MKIIEINNVVCEIVETDLEMYPTYRRYSSDNWERLMGESWEPVYSISEIQKLEEAYNALHEML